MNKEIVFCALSFLLATAIITEPFLLKRVRRKKKRHFCYTQAETIAKLNPLPKNPNWNEINTFLEDSQYGYNIPDNRWFEQQPTTKNFKISKKSVAVLQCLSKDMEHIFHRVYIEYDRATKEDKNSKYECVRELLEIKYSKLSESLRYKIYEQFINSYENYRRYS